MTSASGLLASALSPSQVRTDLDSLREWGRDWTRAAEPSPAAVVFPETTDDVIAIVRLANSEGLKLVPSGPRKATSPLCPMTGRGGAVAVFPRRRKGTTLGGSLSPLRIDSASAWSAARSMGLSASPLDLGIYQKPPVRYHRNLRCFRSSLIGRVFPFATVPSAALW